MKFHFHSGKIWTGFRWNFEIWAVQKYENLVDLEKCCKNDYLVAIVAVHTAENEPLKVWGWFHSFFIREKMLTIFGWIFEIWAVQKYENLVDLEKPEKMSIWLLS